MKGFTPSTFFSMLSHNRNNTGLVKTWRRKTKRKAQRSPWILHAVEHRETRNEPHE